jgi:catechol 2,3-dioxygenase-like lactoylglutathione lyase family enzyme
MTKLAQQEATATVATKDLAAARKFYEGTLGLAVVVDNAPTAITFKSGKSSQLIVYQSTFAGTNKATAVNWIVDADVEGVVAELRGRGVAFEHYDMPGIERSGDLHVAGGWKSAWFKDPDGNILCAMGR